MNTKASGDIGEQIAAEYLKEQGYEILERNAKYLDCEVDIICSARLDEEGNPVKTGLFKRIMGKEAGEFCLIFVEVKTRYGNEYGRGAEAVTPYKAGRYVLAAQNYCQIKGVVGKNVRFDVIEINDGELNHIRSAYAVDYAKFYRR